MRLCTGGRVPARLAECGPCERGKGPVRGRVRGVLRAAEVGCEWARAGASGPSGPGAVISRGWRVGDKNPGPRCAWWAKVQRCVKRPASFVPRNFRLVVRYPNTWELSEFFTHV